MVASTKLANVQIVLSTITPLALGIFGAQCTMVIADRYGWNTAPFVLIGLCFALIGLAVRLNRSLYRRSTAPFPLLTAIAVVLSIWLWQQLAYKLLVPLTGLTYGYFLRPEGAKARFWVLDCPFWVGVGCLLVCFAAAMVSGWRAGARLSLLCQIPWWLTTVLIFALPSLYLDGQGNATIFI